MVILHEEAEDGNAMPDLEQPVKVVSNAVSNLVKVGTRFCTVHQYQYTVLSKTQLLIFGKFVACDFVNLKRVRLLV